MKISGFNTNYSYNQLRKVKVQPKQTPPVLNKKFLLPAVAVSLISLFASTCSNTRGGNFVYNEATSKIEKFEPKKLDINDMDYCKTNKFNLRNCYDKEYLKSMDIDKWIEENKETLTGSCLFDTNKNPMSILIEKVTNQSHCDYVPSHAASIYEGEDGQMKVMQIKPCKVVVEDLADYLKNTKNNYVVFLRDFEINKDRFCENVKKEEGKPYGFISAGQSVSSLVNIDGGLHCSEGYVKDVQKEGLFKNIDANKITPHTLLHLLTNRGQDTTTF